MTNATSPPPKGSVPSPSILDRLAAIPGLEHVEELIGRSMQCQAPTLSEIATYLHQLGGKRIRPILCLTTAQACGHDTENSPRLTEIASGIELIHLATLLHDDIIDNSPIRRHKPSPFAKYGLAPTLLAGDFLLVRAFGLCSRLDPTIIAATEISCVELTEGEVLETPLYCAAHTIDSSLDIARRKTASLFRLATFSAAVLSALDSESQENLAKFGEELGIAFQILDDVLDVTSEETTLGKRPGMDLRERKPSIINVKWLLSGSQGAKHLLTPPGPLDEEWVSRSLHELAQGPIVEEARSLAATRMQGALNALERGIKVRTPRQQDALALLYDLAQFTLARAM